MLLAAFSKFSHTQFEKLAKQSVSWSVRFLIYGTPSGTIESYYAKIAVDIWNDKITKMDGALSVMRPILPKDDDFRIAFVSATESKAKIARYYLQALQHEADGTIASDALTLEHVLDKKYDSTRHAVSAEEHKDYLQRIGNLTLIDEGTNGSMQGMVFSKKAPILAKATNPSLTQQVGKSSKWGTAEIEARQKKLADLAVKTWPI